MKYWILNYKMSKSEPKLMSGKYGPLVGAIDQGTSSSRFFVSPVQCS